MTLPRHPSDEQLWTGGEAVDDHLAGCLACRTRRHDLTAEQQRVTDWLRAGVASTASPQMPDDVTARLDEVVRREARERMTDGVVAPLPRGADRRGVLRTRAWLVAAAVAGVAVVGGSLLVPALDRTDLLAGSGDDAATEASDALGDTPAEAALAPLPPVPADVAEQAQAQARDETLGTCGQALAEQLGGTVVAATEVSGDRREGVLVTVDTDGQRLLWWLPGCEATRESALGRSQVQ